MGDLASVIIAANIDNTQRSLIQEWIKNNAEQWWHQLPDVWVVVGHGPTYWRDSIKAFALPGTSILVLAVKNTKGDRWGSIGIEQGSWFTENLPPVSDSAVKATRSIAG